MGSQKMYELTAVAVTAAGVAGLLIAAAQDGRGTDVQVLLRPARGAIQTGSQSSCRLTIPRRFFARGTSVSDSVSSAGIDRLILELEGADVDRALGGSAPDLAGASLRIELATPEMLTEGFGERRRDEALNQAPDFPQRMSVRPPIQPGEITEYVFANISPRAMAYHFEGPDGAVFVDCSERPVCRGFQTWRGVLDVRYQYQRADLDDPRPMNEAVMRLLESFQPVSVRTAAQPGAGDSEHPVFEPSPEGFEAK